MRKNLRIFWLIYRSYFLIALISLVTVSWYISSSIKEFSLDQFESDLQIRNILLSGQVIPLLSPLDHVKLQDLCIKVGLTSGTRITVVLPDGSVVGDTDKEPFALGNHLDRPEIKNAISQGSGVSIRYSGTLEQNMMYLAIALKSGSELVAVLRTSVPTTKVDKEISAIQNRIFMGGFLAAVLISALALIVARRIAQPIETLKQGAEQFADGNLEHHLEAPGTLEFNSLADTMNRMAQQLKDRMETIISQRNEYETVLSTLQAGMIALDNDQKILNLNPSAASILNIKSDNFIGKSFQEVVRVLELNDFICEAVSSDTNIIRDITTYQPEKRILTVHSAPLRKTDKERTGTLLIINGDS